MPPGDRRNLRSNLLRNFLFGKQFIELTHGEQISGGITLRVLELFLQVLGQGMVKPASPSCFAFHVDDVSAKRPVEADQFAVDTNRGFDLGLLESLF